MVYEAIERSQVAQKETVLNQSPVQQSIPTTIYSFAVIVESLSGEKKRECLTAYFKESPFRFEIDEWAKSITGKDYRVVDSFFLSELNF